MTLNDKIRKLIDLMLFDQFDIENEVNFDYEAEEEATENEVIYDLYYSIVDELKPIYGCNYRTEINERIKSLIP